MNELERALAGDSAATPPAGILAELPAQLVHHVFENVPHTIHQELWHIAFWQQISLDWIFGIETPYPNHSSDGFPHPKQTDGEPWPELCARFFSTLDSAAAAARDASRLETVVNCPSRPSAPARRMTVREQLESLAAHNAYHFGRMVLLRQLGRAWPPSSGGFQW
jgi:uncharacterized damage-inducible protein DinB